MKSPKLQEVFHAIFDKRLYGFSFFWRTGPFLGLGFVTQVLIYLVLNRLMLYIYIPLFIMLILTSGLGSKNFRREVHNMGYFRGFLFLLASVLASTLPFTLRLENTWYGLYQFHLTFAISNLTLVIAIVEVTIWGQRVSLRKNMRLNDDFFEKQKKVWEKNLEGFPNFKKIISNIDDGRFVAALFDRGSFNLVVLWSCNVMEKITDAVAEGITSKNPKNVTLFEKEDGRRERYPEQLKNLGYKLNAKDGNDTKQMTLEFLWHELRNDVAHRNYKPTFEETSGALNILVNFMEKMPETLQAWK